ncbi:hypothetical protein [Haloprofundus halophilus]|uniref:hypothetical protein n=1 Tax=Haloprofundus halophilus TaxID=2283527 RepID=UPI0013005EF2|nr:hypothetical protein [Haloprofundus halophilus]
MTLLAFPFFLFWNTTVARVNIGLGDLLLLAAGSILLVTGKLRFAMSKLSAVATLTFLAVALVSLTFTPSIWAGVLDFVQYFYIFVVVIPIVLTVADSHQFRYHAALIIWGALLIVAIVSIFASIFIQDIPKFSSVFESYTQFRWLLAVGAIYAVAFLLDDIHENIKFASIIYLLSATPFIFGGITLSAMLAYGVGIWLVLSWHALRRGHNYLWYFSVMSCVLATVGIVVVALKWSTIYQMGSLGSRLEMYKIAFRGGINGIPLGNGIHSSQMLMHQYGLPPEIPPTIHNFVFHFFFEIGLLGVLAFLIIVGDWVRTVFISVYRSPSSWHSYDIAFVAVFAAYLCIAFFQPPPVHRIWWVHFALAWAAQNEVR